MSMMLQKRNDYPFTSTLESEFGGEINSPVRAQNFFSSLVESQCQEEVIGLTIDELSPTPESWDAKVAHTSKTTLNKLKSFALVSEAV